MGYSAYANLVVGVLVTKTVIQKNITKYHEDTGKPYQKRVTEDSWVIAGTKITLPDCDYEAIAPLESFFSNHESDAFVLGIKVTEETEAISPLTLDAVRKTLDLVTTALQGLLKEYSIEQECPNPKVYLILRHSY